ncbi:MAG: hypothetical protein RDU59_11915 [Thermodesulfobacteriota bacterium]|nr:hypothetical protein [Thermodesulfobacteriota bacterium]
MDNTNYQGFVKQAERGEILIGIEPALARKFFTDTEHKAIQQEIGEALFIERFFVKAVWLLEFISLLAGVVASIFALGWYSAIAIPVMIVGVFILGGKASMGTQKIGGAVFLVIFCFFLAFYFREKGPALFLWLVLLPMPYFFARLTYKLATFFLRALSLRNEKVFNLLYDKAIFLKKV